MKKEISQNHVCVNVGNTALYLITYQWAGIGDNKHICDKWGLVKAVTDAKEKGIQSIKIFDYTKEKFVRISKAKILDNVKYDTEIIEKLRKHYYFDRVK